MRRFTFLEYIRRYFGGWMVTQLKCCMKIMKSIVHTRIRIKFLKGCIQHNLIPSHLSFLRARHLVFHNKKFANYFGSISLPYILRVLRLELRDSFSFLYGLRSEFFRIHRFLYSFLPSYLISRFFNGQEKRNIKLWQFLNNKTSRKIDGLRRKHNTEIRSRIAPIRFSANNIDNEQFEINITPDKFDTSPSFNKPQEKWFINLSGYYIPEEVTLLLQLGERFNLPLTDKKNTSFELIKSVEKNIYRQDEHVQNTVRNKTISMINLMYQYTEKEIIDKTLINWAVITNKFCKDNKDILFTRADKGNTTVALNKIEYMTKMTNLLSDTSTYKVINKDPSRKITESLKGLLSRWKKKGYVDEYAYKMLNNTDGLLPRAYGLPKIHKQGCPLRIIISSTNSTLFSLANFLHKIIQKSLPNSKSYIKNSFDLVEKLKLLNIDTEYHLASLDVVSLFTNIPVETAITSLEKRWILISRNTSIPQNEFFIATNLILNSTYFSFNNSFYKQIFGTPMGSPLSPIIADIVMQDLEEVAISKLHCTIPIYFRYVDDILLAAKENEFDNILKTFNSVHERLQLTMERNLQNYINFLNVRISFRNNRFFFNLYHKPTFSFRYLNFLSHHPLMHKKGVIIGLVDKVIMLSEPEFYCENLENVISNLQNNGYPLNFIFETIKNRLKFLVHDKGAPRERNNNNKKFFPIPYVKCISKKFSSLLNKNNFTTTFFCNNNLKKFIKTGKDTLEPSKQCGVVYRISCNDCDASYVGQTKRQLQTRIKEHRSDVNKRTGTLSTISSHRIDFNHDFGWNNVEILDRESSYSKRLTSEMIHIKRQHNSLNKQNDTDFFPISYLTVLDLFPSF